MMENKVLIGRSDKIDLPELQLYDIEAKIDTGAYSSAIHYKEIDIIQRNGEDVLQLILVDDFYPNNLTQSFFFFDQFTTTKVKSSNGSSEERFMIQTYVKIFDDLIPTEFTLSDRGNLKFPILLGRKFLQSRFIVDVEKTELSYKQQTQ